MEHKVYLLYCSVECTHTYTNTSICIYELNTDTCNHKEQIQVAELEPAHLQWSGQNLGWITTY